MQAQQIPNTKARVSIQSEEPLKDDSEEQAVHIIPHYSYFIQSLHSSWPNQEEFEDTKGGNQNPYIEEEQTTQQPKLQKLIYKTCI